MRQPVESTKEGMDEFQILQEINCEDLGLDAAGEFLAFGRAQRIVVRQFLENIDLPRSEDSLQRFVISRPSLSGDSIADLVHGNDSEVPGFINLAPISVGIIPTRYKVRENVYKTQSVSRG